MPHYQFKPDLQPFRHQRKGIRFLIEHKGIAALLWEPGTMKTATTLHYLAMLAIKRGYLSVLITAPLSALDTWEDQANLHLTDAVDTDFLYLEGKVADRVEQARELPSLIEAGRTSELRTAPLIQFVVINYDSFSQSHNMPGTKTVKTRNELVKALKSAGLDVLVCDESHRAKGRSSKVSGALGRVAPSFPKRILLTGTVAPHSPFDFWAQWRILNPDRFGTNFNSFKFRYAQMGGFKNKQVMRWVNQDHLAQEIAKDAMTVYKDDVLDLPPIIHRSVWVTLSAKEEKAYNDMGSTLVAGGVAAPNRLVQWLRLRQLTSGHLTDAESSEVTHFGNSKIRVALDLLSDLVSSGEKVVVFAHFSDDVHRMYEAASNNLDCSVWTIEGATPKQERLDVRRAFRDTDGPAVVVCQMRTVSLAVNEFVVASHAVFISQSERQDDFQQAHDRLHRQGQKATVVLHHVMVKGSIDEVMLDAHRDKKDLETAVLANANRIATIKGRRS